MILWAVEKLQPPALRIPRITGEGENMAHIKDDKYLDAGTYTVRATVRNQVTVEPGDKKTEMDLVDEMLEHSGSELVDWEID